MSDDLFLKIIDREIPADIVYETEELLAFRDIAPKAPTHILIIPKVHIPTVNDIEPQHAALIGKMFLVAAELADQEGIAEDGYRLIVNCNRDGGQVVFHLHMHLLGGRKMGELG